MPTDIVLVRHGQCTGNVADRASNKGDHGLFTRDIRNQHSSLWPLTEKGVMESVLTGEWIRNNISQKFDYCYTSDYVRALETARFLGFSEAIWQEDTLLRERNWGGVENLPYPERNLIMRRIGRPETEDSVDWRPPRGESMTQVLQRIKLFLMKTSLKHQRARILVVSHGAPIQAFRMIQHQIGSVNYLSFISGGNYLRNCHIFHYSIRKDGNNGVPSYFQERSVFPDEDSKWTERIHNIE